MKGVASLWGCTFLLLVVLPGLICDIIALGSHKSCPYLPTSPLTCLLTAKYDILWQYKITIQAMAKLATRLSVTELSQRILEMATTGVYRESLFETFKPVATKRQIRDAIAMAKQFGLHSDPAMRDVELGTYYQVDAQRVQTFQTAVAAAISLESQDDVAQRIVETTQALRAVVRLAATIAAGLGLLGGLCVLSGRLQTGAIFWSSGLCAAGIWGIQRLWVRRLLPPKGE